MLINQRILRNFSNWEWNSDYGNKIKFIKQSSGESVDLIT